MKKFLLPVLVILALSTLQSCSEKFKIAAPYKPVTLVYGILDRADTAHYVRVEKAFLDENKNALSMAQDPDSSFFNNINVRIQRMTMSGNPIDTIHLKRVDLNAEGYPKESGIFFNAPNYAYKFTNSLDPNYIYRIIVTNAATGDNDTAEAPVIDNRNSAFYVYYFDYTGPNLYLDFSSTLPNQTVSIYFKYSAPGSFAYSFQGAYAAQTPAYLAQALMRFRWYDSNTTTKEKTARYFDYDLGYTTIPNSTSASFYYDVKNLSFYNALKGGMGPAPANTVRLMDRCQLIAYVATYDFSQFLNAQAIQGVGLTGNEVQMPWTNVKGKNAYGLFTSRTMRSGDITISDGTIVALDTLSLVSELKIQGRVH